MVKLGLKSRQSKAKADQFSIAKKRQANTSIKSDPTGRMESFSDVDINISGLSALLTACKRLEAWVACVGSTHTPGGCLQWLCVAECSPHDTHLVVKAHESVVMYVISRTCSFILCLGVCLQSLAWSCCFSCQQYAVRPHQG